MYSATTRSTKSRNVTTQERLKSRSNKHKQQKDPLDPTRSIYFHSYNVPLPPSSVSLISPVVRGFTSDGIAVNSAYRELHTVGLWATGVDTITRCCFVQLELSSATCTLPKYMANDVQAMVAKVTKQLPGSDPPGVFVRRAVQISGRMTPYVIDGLEAGERAEWGYVNLAKSRMLFIHTSTGGTRILTLSLHSMEILSQHTPPHCACVLLGGDKQPQYKLTAAPDSTNIGDTANKNTSMHVFSDGMFKILGKPSCTQAVAACFKEAVHSVAASRRWGAFIQSLQALDSHQVQPESESAAFQQAHVETSAFRGR